MIFRTKIKNRIQTPNVCLTDLRCDTLPNEGLAGAWRAEEEETLGGAAQPCTGGRRHSQGQPTLNNGPQKVVT